MADNTEPSPRLQALHRLEDGVLALLLFVSLGLALLQIVLRMVFDSGLDWIGPLIRVLMVWLGLWAAMVATREGRQITMDALSQHLSSPVRRRLRRLTDLLAMLVCLLLAGVGWSMTTMTREFADPGPLGWPLWWFQALFPVAMAVMGLRYGLHVWRGWPEENSPDDDSGRLP